MNNTPAFLQGSRIETHAELRQLEQAAIGLIALKGLQRGDAIAIVGPHGPATSAWLLACYRSGNVAVPLSASGSEWRTRAQIASAKLIVKCQFDTWVLASGHSGPVHPLVSQLAAKRRAGLVLFSSGTSGEPKAMVHDLTTLVQSYAGRKPSSLRICILLQFDHIGGINTLLGALASSATLVLPESLSPSDVSKAIEQHKAAVLPASPTFLNLLLASGEHLRHDLSSLRLITYGTEPMPESLLARLREAFPRARFVQTFGTSETGIARTESPDPASLFMRIDDPNQEWKVVDGELWLRSKTQILGYLNASDDRFTPDGWFRTGDKVELGPDNTLRVLGRAGEMINVGGEKLMPAEVESVVFGVPGVLDCRVRGEPNAITGQTVVADVVAAPGSDPDSLRSAIRSSCREKLARHKVPTRVKFVASVSGGRGKKSRI